MRNNPAKRTTSAKLVERWHGVVAKAVAQNVNSIVIKSGKGSHVTDADDKEYLDFAGGIASLPLGHSHPAVVDAIKRQAELFTHVSSHTAYYDVYIRAAEKLLATAPGKLKSGKLLYSNSGTEANEGALKAVRSHRHREMMLAFEGAFHGRTQGSLSVTASKQVHRRGMGSLLGGAVHTPFAYCYRCPYRMTYPDCGLYCVDQIKDVIFKHLYAPDDFAGMIVEPIMGEGGYVPPPDNFLPALRKIANENGMMVIFDEVQCGMGRTGKMFACEHTGVVPDVLTVGKGIASGMPLAATIMTNEIADQWEPGSHGSTFGGNPVSCAASIATLDAIRANRLLSNAERLGKSALARLNEMKEKYEMVGDVRGKGLMIGVELVKDKKSREPASKEADAVLLECLKRGLFVLKCGDSTIRICPALNLTEEELNQGLEILEAALSATSSLKK